MSQHIYDKFADRYDRAVAPFERRFISGWRKELFSYLPSDARTLEIGAGTGSNFPYYPLAHLATASELSFKMLEIAAEKPEAKAIALVQADAEQLPFAANTFDAAFATLVFCSIPTPEKAFAELQRVVMSGGKVFLLEHVRPPGVLGPVFDLLNIFTRAWMEDHFNRRTAKLAEESGLRIIEVKRKAWGIVNLIICEVEK